MTSKEVIDRIKAAQLAVQAAETHGDAAAEALATTLTEHLGKGERIPDVRLLLGLFGRRLAAAASEMVTADDAHEEEFGDDAGPRERRDAAAAALHTQVTELRALLEGTHGAKALAPLGIRGDTPHDPSALAAWVGNLVGRLRDASIDLPAPRRKGLKLDRAAEAEALVTTQWAEDQSAGAMFTIALYEGLRRGMRSADTVTAAMRIVRADDPDPFAWAPFVLIGRDDVIDWDGATVSASLASVPRDRRTRSLASRR